MGRVSLELGDMLNRKKVTKNIFGENSFFLFGIGIAGILLTLFVMYNSKLYAEFSLNIYYLVMSIYGWLYWKFGKSKHEIEISQTQQKEWGIVAFIVLSSFLIFISL